jgi:hypothetical protein
VGSFFVLGGSVYGVAMVRDRPVKFMMVGELKDRLDEVLERKKMSATDAFEGMTKFLLEQDSLAQSLLLGQIEPRDRPDLVEIVLKRLAVNGTGRGLQVKETHHSGRKSQSDR